MPDADAQGTVETWKRAAAERACEWIHDGMVLGLGTGSTVRHLLDLIAERRARGEWLRLVGVATSVDTERRANALRIPLSTLREHPRIAMTIDGADEVDPHLDLVKGLGGALLREKVVASVSARLLIVADETKEVQKLATRAPVPVEVDPFAADVLPSFFRSLGARPVLRRNGTGEPLRTDGGHHIFDCYFDDGITDPHALDAELLRRAGVIETGLFLDMADTVIVAARDGVRVRVRHTAEVA